MVVRERSQTLSTLEEALNYRQERRNPRFRPLPSPKDPSVYLRKIAGVREDAIKWVPEDYPRYSRLGLIILNAATLAAVSLAVALLSLSSMSIWWALPAAILWGLTVGTFDSWLVSSTHGSSGTSRVRIFLPRLAISVLIGFVIAEPLLLQVFSPSIMKEVLQTRQAELDLYESALKDCNPDTGAVDPRPQCSQFRISIPGSPQSIQRQIDDLTTQRSQLATEVGTITTTLKQKEDLARDECNGAKGPGLSGIYGEGTTCKVNRAEAAGYRADSQLDAKTAKVVDLDQQVSTLAGNLSTAKQGYAVLLNTAIVAKVAERKQSQGDVGLLDEDAALGRLASASWFVWIGSWLFRLLLIVVDCMPVMAKLLGGRTRYDEIISRQLAAGKLLHGKDVDVRERWEGVTSDVEVERIEQARREALSDIEEADRAVRARRAGDIDDEIDKLAARLRGDM